MITVWAALESMAARLIIQRATDDEIAELKTLFTTFDGGTLTAQIDEYSESNIEFHQALFRLSRCDLLGSLTGNLFLHMRSIVTNAVPHVRADVVINIDQMRHANRHEGKMADQRSVVTFRENSRNVLAHWLCTLCV